MPFPFLPLGAILAAAVLIGALLAFGLILRMMDRAIVGVRDSAVSGLVAGWRTWSAQGAPAARPISSPARSDPPADLADLAEIADIVDRRIGPSDRPVR